MRRADLLVLAMVAALCLAGPTRAQPAPFDHTLWIQHADLGPSRCAPGQRCELRCCTCPGFMVKEIDEREVGDEKISIVPRKPGAAAPRCDKMNAAGDHVIPADPWPGYVLGAKGRSRSVATPPACTRNCRSCRIGMPRQAWSATTRRRS